MKWFKTGAESYVCNANKSDQDEIRASVTTIQEEHRVWIVGLRRTCKLMPNQLCCMQYPINIIDVRC